jgi:RNA polymerase sigma factor (sigma-70 family)
MRQALGNDAPLPEQLVRDRGWTEILARVLAGSATDDLSEDAVQDTWVAALRRPPSAEAPLAGWARTVVRHQLLNRLRSDNRRRSREARTPLADPPPDPDELLARRQIHEILVEAVTELAEPYRRTVVLRYFEGLSSAEIAARMNVPPATARGRLKTALGLLREALERRRVRPQGWLEMLARPRAGDLRRPPAAPATPPALVRRFPAPLVRTLAGLALVTAAAAPVWTSRRHSNAPPPPAAPAAAAAPSFVAAVPEAPRATTTLPAPPAAPLASPTPPRAAAPLPLINGRVFLAGEVPAAPTVEPPHDPACPAQPLRNEEVVVGPDGGLANVVVHVTSGPARLELPPTEPAVLRIEGCRYRPRVLVVRASQGLLVQNDDRIVHLMRMWRGPSLLFNQGLVPGSHLIRPRVDGSEELRFDTEDHPGTTAYVVVVDGPFFAVTGEDGRFALAVPPGRYGLEAWHERFGSRRGYAYVAQGHGAEVSFTFGDRTFMPFTAQPCSASITGNSPVAIACRSGGIRAAKQTMKKMQAAAKNAGFKIQCDECHQDEERYALLPGARARFERLLAASGAAPDRVSSGR